MWEDSHTPKRPFSLSYILCTQYSLSNTRGRVSRTEWKNIQTSSGAGDNNVRFLGLVKLVGEESARTKRTNKDQ